MNPPALNSTQTTAHTSNETNAPFAPTRWTLILRAQGETSEAQAALGELCEAYYTPVQRFLQREGRDPDAARELTQEFFAGILAGRAFDGADPARGRFRSYLLGALKHFLADRRKHGRRLKRGGGLAPSSLDAPSRDREDDGNEASAAAIADPASPNPEALFDREWALTIMARALEALEREMAGTDKASPFGVLKPWLMGDTPALSQADAAKTLGTTEGAIKVMVHRLRKRFRATIRSEIAQTLRDPALVDEELRHLIEALA